MVRMEEGDGIEGEGGLTGDIDLAAGMEDRLFQ